MTDIQQVIPQARPGGRGFRAYSAKHLDMLVQRAGLSPGERLAVRAVATPTADYLAASVVATCPVRSVGWLTCCPGRAAR